MHGTDRRAARRDPDRAREIAERLLPDPGLRRRVLELFAGSVERAHDANPESWSLTIGGDGSFLGLNVGPVFALDLVDERIRWITLDRDGSAPVRVPADDRSASEGRFRVLPGVMWRRTPAAELLASWEQYRADHRDAVEKAARARRRTPFYLHHAPGLVEYLGAEIGRLLPRPGHDGGTAGVDASHGSGILDLVRRYYGEWTGLDTPRFVEEEITYKREASAAAQQELSAEEFRRLLDGERWDEMIGRLEKVGKSTNLLYIAAPRTSDLAILYAEDLDKAELCRAVFDLLHGDGESPARLSRFSEFLAGANLPQRWTFPTYFLFLLDPQREYFVKPRTTRWFLQFIGAGDLYDPVPSGELYEAILGTLADLREELGQVGPRDMIDLQSLIYVAAAEAREEEQKLSAAETNAAAADSEGSDASDRIVTLSDVSATTHLPVDTLERWLRATRRKRQAVLYGPPGTGKTYLATRLAEHLVAGADGFHELVQFHPSYSYEDFIQGIRPERAPGGGLDYPLRQGRFLEVCERARSSEGTCVLIIDEINRANLSRVFGELMYLLENRGVTVPLAGGGTFSIPKNLVLLGTMNTADRSIALVDYALRRRFAFIHVRPNFDVLRRYQQVHGFDPEPLIRVLQNVNAKIGDPHYHLGPSFFLVEDLAADLEDIWQLEIEPYLEEYFYGQSEAANVFRWQQVAGEIHG